MTEKKGLPNVHYGLWGYFLLLIGLAGISAFVLFINQDSVNSIGISTQKLWTIWGGVFAILLLGLIISPVWWRWRLKKNQTVYKPQIPEEKIGQLDIKDGDRVQPFPSLKNIFNAVTTSSGAQKSACY
ncbi:hypothetical protein [Pantoea ananatis]|uniref:hypothetical protein n=1 Tax=Pantoea ananas TaxID=553 RepID=UPI001FF0DB6A|nr:hypothetical protein [Pantoea ananatis]